MAFRTGSSRGILQFATNLVTLSIDAEDDLAAFELLTRGKRDCEIALAGLSGTPWGKDLQYSEPGRRYGDTSSEEVVPLWDEP